MEVNFYQLLRTPLIKALPKLIETVYSKGNKILVHCQNKEDVAYLDNLLWTYEQLSFLPHVTGDDPHQEITPVIISTDDEPKNHAEIMVLASLELPVNFSKFTKVLTMYNHDNAEHLLKVKKIKDALPSADCEIKNYDQTITGSWKLQNVV